MSQYSLYCHRLNLPPSPFIKNGNENFPKMAVMGGGWEIFTRNRGNPGKRAVGFVMGEEGEQGIFEVPLHSWQMGINNPIL